jgi:hypothetical protein
MTPLEWRALVDAYVGGRLSADTFKRRFVEAFEAAVAERASVPRSVQELYFTVEAYGGDPMGRGHDVADDAAMAEAARRALGQLAVEPALAQDPRIDEQERAEAYRTAEARARRAAFTVGAVGAAGCLLGLAWLVIVALQFFAASALVQSVTSWGPGSSAVVGLIVAVVPILGSVTAFFGAKDVWQWHWALAALVFFAFPAATYIGGWRQWVRRVR